MKYGNNVIFPKESYDIIGAAMKVHSTLGCGFSEKVYQDALAVEFSRGKIPFQREVELHVVYNNVTLPTTFIPDFICYGKIIVELKAVKELDDIIVLKLTTMRKWPVFNWHCS